MNTKDRLREQCERIADEISIGNYAMEDWELEEWDEPCAAHYLSDALDMEYTVTGNFEYRGARVCVALGGPNIYIDTRYNVVRGYWGGDSVEVPYSHDKLGVDAYCCERYDASR